jgi:hypothetical protein
MEGFVNEWCNMEQKDLINSGVGTCSVHISKSPSLLYYYQYNLCNVTLIVHMELLLIITL